MALTYFLSQKKGNTGTLMLVLSGVVVGAVFEALTSFIKYVADPEEKLPAITYWLMGSLSGSSMTDVFRHFRWLASPFSYSGCCAGG